jgi:uncharacterized protein YndB with AHSA1/START domain
MSTDIAERHGIITEAGTIVFERLLPGPIERVWEYLTDSEKRGKWLASGPMEQRVGGAVELNFRNSDLSPVHEAPPAKYKDAACASVKCQVTACEKPRLLAYLWGDEGSEVTFELAQAGDKVRLRLTHRRLPNRDFMISVAGGWHTHLGILADQLAGNTPRPFWSTHAALEREYDQRIS